MTTHTEETSPDHTISATVQAMGGPSPAGEARLAAIRPHVAFKDEDCGPDPRDPANLPRLTRRVLRVVNPKTGETRLAEGGKPMTLEALIAELAYHRTLAVGWKPYGSSY